MKRIGLVVAIGLSSIYAVYWSWFTIGRHHTTNSTRFDLGNAEQVIWKATQGRIFHSTDPYGTREVTRLAYHADLFLLALVPIYTAAPYTETLLILQSLALASSVLAVFLLARAWLKSTGWALVFTSVFAITPGLHWLNAFDFHAVAFAVPLILWCMFAAVQQRYGWMIILASAAMLTKEEIGLAVLPISAYLYFRAKQSKWALLMLAPAIWSVMMMLVVLPAVQHKSIQPSNIYSSQFGDTAPEIFTNVLFHPKQIWQIISTTSTRIYGFQLLAPFGFLPLGHWLVLGSIPDGVINIVSGKDTQQTILFHYQAGILPWLMIASIAAVAWVRQRFSKPNWSPLIAGWLIVWAGVGAWLYGPLPGAKLDYSRVVRWHNQYVEPVRQWANQIPTGAAVSVTNNIGAHFARRQQLFSFPLGISQAGYAVVLEGHQQPEVATQAEVTVAVRQLEQDPNWDTIFHQADLTIFQRRVSP